MQKVTAILSFIPTSRDDDNLLIEQYIDTFWKINPKDYASIIRIRALIQQRAKELRWDKWEARQKHSKTLWREYRQKRQEMPEELLINKDFPKIEFHWSIENKPWYKKLFTN